MFAVHYKFKSAKDEYSTITFDTPTIPLVELKDRIFEKSKLKRTEDFDLKIVNAQTGEDYSDTRKYNDYFPIPKNTSVVVSREPVAKGNRVNIKGPGGVNGGSAIQNRHKANRILGPNYICYRCNKPGHFIDECPTNGDPSYDFLKVKKATGIPKSFLKPVTEGEVTKNTLRMPNGSLAVFTPNERVFEREHKAPRIAEDEIELPEKFKCPLCKGVLKDPLLIPCCLYSFCSECIQPEIPTETLLCPTCKRVTQPNRFERNKMLSDEIEAWMKEKEEASNPTSDDENGKKLEGETINKTPTGTNNDKDQDVRSEYRNTQGDDLDNRDKEYKEYRKYDDRYHSDRSRDYRSHNRGRDDRKRYTGYSAYKQGDRYYKDERGRHDEDRKRHYDRRVYVDDKDSHYDSKRRYKRREEYRPY